MKIYTNRDGVKYTFEPVSDTEVEVKGNFLPYWRCGGKEGQDGIDMNDLGFWDPPGGPFLSIDQKIEGRKVVKIRVNDKQVFLTLESV